MIAWGKSCDVKWLFNAKEVSQHDTLDIPAGLNLLLNPGHIISQYTSCKLKKKKRDEPGHSLEKIYRYITNKTSLEGA